MIALMQKKKNCFNFSKANTKFCLCLEYSNDESYLYVNKMYQDFRKDEQQEMALYLIFHLTIVQLKRWHS